MFRFKSTIAVVVAMAIASSAYAFTSVVDLSPGEDGFAGPGGWARVNLNKLRPEVAYNVKCAIKSDNKSMQNQAYIKVKLSDHSGSDSVVMLMDGEVQYSFQAKVNGTPDTVNSLELRGVSRANHDILMANLDDTDALTIQSCYAVPAIG